MKGNIFQWSLCFGSKHFSDKYCPNGEKYFPCSCDINYISCENVPPSEIANVFRKTSPKDLYDFTIKGSSSTANELNLPAHFLAYHTFRGLDLYCSSSLNDDNKNSTAIRPQLTIDPDAFSSTRNVTTSLFICDCDLSRLNFTFLDRFDQLKKLTILNSPNFEMAYRGGFPLLPALEELYIQDENGNLNICWADNWSPLKFGISALSLVGVGFSGDETADRILQWIHRSSAETLTSIELINWENLTRIPRWLSYYKKLESLRIICDNFEMPIIEENSIVFNASIRLFSLENCGIKEIKPGAIQGTLSFIFFKFRVALIKNG